MAEVHYMSQEGLEKLKKDLADALAQRPVISAAIAEAREKGDLSENAEYDAARDAQGLLEVKIANLKNQVANAKVIDESMKTNDGQPAFVLNRIHEIMKENGIYIQNY